MIIFLNLSITNSSDSIFMIAPKKSLIHNNKYKIFVVILAKKNVKDILKKNSKISKYCFRCNYVN